MVNIFREEQRYSSGVIETSDNASTVSPYWIASAYVSGMLLFFLPPPSSLQQQCEGRTMSYLGPSLSLIGITSCGLFFPASQASLCLSGNGCSGHFIIHWA